MRATLQSPGIDSGNRWCQRARLVSLQEGSWPGTPDAASKGGVWPGEVALCLAVENFQSSAASPDDYKASRLSAPVSSPQGSCLERSLAPGRFQGRSGTAWVCRGAWPGVGGLTWPAGGHGGKEEEGERAAGSDGVWEQEAAEDRKSVV